MLPIHGHTGRVAGVLDMDSQLLGRFDEEDRQGLLEIVKVIEGLI